MNPAIAERATGNIFSGIKFDSQIWKGRHRLSRLIIYALAADHLALAPEPIPQFEETALFPEYTFATLKNGEYLVQLPSRIYNFYRLDEADYTVMASEIKPRTIEILLY